MTIWYQSSRILAPRSRPVKEIMAELEMKEQMAALVAAVRDQTTKFEG
jgi:hypothetical protein